MANHQRRFTSLPNKNRWNKTIAQPCLSGDQNVCVNKRYKTEDPIISGGGYILRKQSQKQNNLYKRLLPISILFMRTFLVAQWLRVCLPMQGTWVRTLVWEDTTCRGVTKPVRHNYWACALEPLSHNFWACVPQLLKPEHLEPVLCNKRNHRNEKPAHHNKE